MTNFEKIKSLDIDKLADWIVENGAYDDAPWVKHFCKNYCDKCEPSMKHSDYFNTDVEVGFCEMHNFCKFFPENKEIPSVKEEVMLWLMNEVE